MHFCPALHNLAMASALTRAATFVAILTVTTFFTSNVAVRSSPELAALTLITAVHTSLVLSRSLHTREPWLALPLAQSALAIAYFGEPIYALQPPLPLIAVCCGLSLPVLGGVVASSILVLDTKLGWLKRYHRTYVGAVLSHGINIPCWTLMFNTPLGASTLLVCGGWHAVLGAALWLLMSTLNWGIKLPFCPKWVDSIYNLDMTKVVHKGELRGQLDAMGRERTLYMFHPHGVLSGGWTCNGCYSREFNLRAGEMPAQEGTRVRTTGAVFLIDRLLCDVSSFFKLLCDASGRLHSATKSNVKRLMAAGRNVCIIPGGLEEAALFE